MNFYPAPPVIEAQLYLRIPDEIRCIGKETEWRGGFARNFQDIDTLGNLYIVDVPFGRILKIDPSKNVTVAAEWDGEPNGLAPTADGDLLIADYKQVWSVQSTQNAEADIMSRAFFSSILAQAASHQK